jgi:3-deoxy-manno-octulosonate cytidylyltransferase (CMP-KDO synthetase)
MAETLDKVVIAAGDELIAVASRDFGAKVVEVYSDYPSGTDRIARAVEILFPGKSKPLVIVNIQGDEPLLNPQSIDSVVSAVLNDSRFDVATCRTIIQSVEELNDPAAVKVVVDNNGKALYFTRAAVPHGWDKDNNSAFRHVGLYAFRWKVLSAYSGFEECELERAEKLEQLRLMYHGIDIFTVLVKEKSPGVDTEADLVKVRNMISEI